MAIKKYIYITRRAHIKCLAGYYLVIFIFLTTCKVILELVSVCPTLTFCVWHLLKTLTLKGLDLSLSAVRLRLPRLALRLLFLTWETSWQFSSSMIEDTVDLMLHLRWLHLRTVGDMLTDVFVVETEAFFFTSWWFSVSPCLLTEPGPVLIAGNFVLFFFSHLMRDVLRDAVVVVPRELNNK